MTLIDHRHEMGYKGSGPRERLPHPPPPPPLILHPHYLSPLAGICCTMLQQQRYLVILLLVAFSFCIHLQPAASSLSSQDEQERGVIAIHHHTNPNGRPRMGIARSEYSNSIYSLRKSFVKFLNSDALQNSRFQSISW